MLKLVYSLLSYSDLIKTGGALNGKWENVNGDFYRSVVFTSDGYILTHGQALKAINTSATQGVTVTNTNGSLVVNVGNISSTGVNVLIGAENGNHTTKTVTNGIVKFDHNTPGTGTSSLGAIFGTGDNKYLITTNTATYDSYGHINGTSVGTATHIDYITDDVAGNSTSYYLLGSASSSKVSDYYAPKKHSGLYASVGSDGKVTLHADNIAASVSSLTGTLGVSHGGTGTTSFTTGQVLVGNGTNAVSTKAIDTTVTNASSNLITSGAVYTAISNSFAANDAMVFKGITGTPTSTGLAVGTLATDSAGYTWKVGTAGYFNPSDGKIYTTAASGRQKVEIGDLIICITDGKTENGTTINATYGVVQTNIENPISGFVGGTSSNLKRAVLLNITSNDGYLYVELLMRPVQVSGTQKIANNVTTALNFVNGTGLEVSYDNGIKYSLSSISGLSAVTTKGLYKITYNAQGQITGTSSWDPKTLTIKNEGNTISNAVAYDPDGSASLTINFANGLVASWASNVYTVGHTLRFGTGGTTSGTVAIKKIAYDNYGHITNTSDWDPNTLTVKSGGNAITNAVVYDPDSTTGITLNYTNGLSATYSGGTYTIGHSSTGATSMKTGGRTYINSITIDTYGHVTAISTGTENVVNTWRPIEVYKINTTNGKPLNLSGTTWADLTWNSTSKEWTGEKRDVWKSNSTGTNALTFSSSFTLNASDELDLAWAEIDSNGNVTYSV